MTDLREQVYRANMDLQASGLVLYTFGNVSGVDRTKGTILIKPSGVPYEDLAPDNMVEVNLATGKATGPLKPSSDTPTHLEMYRAFPKCGGIVHTHSEFATAFAQALMPIRCTGTTHADYFCGDIPVTRPLMRNEVNGNYEESTGLVIAATFKNINPDMVRAVLVAQHGPFVWGADAADAVHNAVIVEYLAKTQYKVEQLNPGIPQAEKFLINKHYMRKNGTGAYYGQKDS